MEKITGYLPPNFYFGMHLYSVTPQFSILISGTSLEINLKKPTHPLPLWLNLIPPLLGSTHFDIGTPEGKLAIFGFARGVLTTKTRTANKAYRTKAKEEGPKGEGRP